MSVLNVFYEEFKVGTLTRDEELTYSFKYTSEWLEHSIAFPLSLALPLTQDSFGNRASLFFL